MFDRVKSRLVLTGSASRKVLNCIEQDTFLRAGGIYINEISDIKGAVISYQLLPTGAIADSLSYSGQLFLDFSTGRAIHNTEIIRTYGVRLLQEASWYDFSIFNYLGGFELIVPEFYQALIEYLNTCQPCVISIISMNEAEIMRRRLGLSLRYTMAVSKIITGLKKTDNVQVLDTDHLSERKLYKIINEWSSRYT